MLYLLFRSEADDRSPNEFKGTFGDLDEAIRTAHVFEAAGKRAYVFETTYEPEYETP